MLVSPDTRHSLIVWRGECSPRTGTIKALTVIGTNSNYLIKWQLMSGPCQISHCPGRSSLSHITANWDFCHFLLILCCRLTSNIPLSPLSSEVRGIPGDVSPVSPHPPLGQDRRNEKRTKTPLPFPQLMWCHYPDLFLIMVGFLKILLQTLLPSLGN